MLNLTETVPLRCQSRISLWEWCCWGIVEEDGVKPLVIFTFRHAERFVVWQEGEMFPVLEALVMSRIWAPGGNNHLWLWMPLMRFQRLTSAGDWHCNSRRVMWKVIFLAFEPLHLSQICLCWCNVCRLLILSLWIGKISFFFVWEFSFFF